MHAKSTKSTIDAVLASEAVLARWAKVRSSREKKIKDAPDRD
jgi:hypothetical protein